MDGDIATGTDQFFPNKTAHKRGKEIDTRSAFLFIVDHTPPRDLGKIEVAAGLLGSVRIGFNIGELIDFILGWTTIDIFDDDLEMGSIETADLPAHRHSKR